MQMESTVIHPAETWVDLEIRGTDIIEQGEEWEWALCIMCGAKIREIG